MHNRICSACNVCVSQIEKSTKWKVQKRAAGAYFYVHIFQLIHLEKKEQARASDIIEEEASCELRRSE